MTDAGSHPDHPTLPRYVGGIQTDAERASASVRYAAMYAVDGPMRATCATWERYAYLYGHDHIAPSGLHGMVGGFGMRDFTQSDAAGRALVLAI